MAWARTALAAAATRSKAAAPAGRGIVYKLARVGGFIWNAHSPTWLA